jgi:hypothetical protein
VIYICVPAHDEAATVGVLLWKIRQVMADFPRDYQLLVVDDASTDSTSAVLAPYTRVLPLTVLRHDHRKGYAAALDALLREAVRRSAYPRRDAVITLQGDFTEAPDAIPALVKRIEAGADVVTGAARLDGGRVPRAVRWARRLLPVLLRRRAPGISDPFTTFRAYRVGTLKRALEARDGGALVEGDGWAANVALLAAVLPFARKVAEVEVDVRYDRRQRETRFRAWSTAMALARLRSGRAALPAAHGSEAPGERAAEAVPAGGDGQGPDGRRRRSRSRRGGRRRGGQETGDGRQDRGAEAGGGAGGAGGDGDAAGAAAGGAEPVGAAPSGRRRRGSRRTAESGAESGAEAAGSEGPAAGERGAAGQETVEGPDAAPRKRPRRRGGAGRRRGGRGGGGGSDGGSDGGSGTQTGGTGAGGGAE